MHRGRRQHIDRRPAPRRRRLPNGFHRRLVRIVKAVHQQRHAMDAEFVQPLPAPRGPISCRAVADSAPTACRTRGLCKHRSASEMSSTSSRSRRPSPATTAGQCLVEAENSPACSFQSRAEVQAAVEVAAADLSPEAVDLAGRRPRIGPISRPGRRESARRLEARISSAAKAVAEQAVARWARRPGKYPGRGTWMPRSSAGRTPAGEGRLVPPAKRRRGRRTRPEGPGRGGKTPPSDYRRPVRIGWEARA